MRNLWLEKRLAELRPSGKNKKGLALALGVEPPRVTEIIKGERKIHSNEILPMADYLEWPMERILAHVSPGTTRPAPLGFVMVQGAAQAGAWREAMLRDRTDWYAAPVSTVRKYAHLPQFGLEVVGPSMNEIFPHGSVVVCVGLIDLGRDARPGEKVVVLRRDRRHDGFEVTIKELRRDENGGYWLWPRSNDPNFQQPWRIKPPGELDENEDIRIAALVIGYYAELAA